jgi:hypothetical protein
MNMAANRDGFVPSGPAARSQTVSAKGWVCLACTALFVACAGYASVLGLLSRKPPPLLAADVAIDKLPAALKALPASERQSLILRERSWLAANSLNRGALVNLSLLYSADGQEKLAEDLAIAAAKLALRDGKAQAAALQVQLKRGDVADALYRLDALIRSKPEIQDALFATVLALTASKEGKGPVVELLARDPPWRQAFLGWAAEKSDKPQLAYQLISALKSADASPTNLEVQSLIRHYVNAGDHATAYFIWLDLLSEMELRKAGNVFDGGFDLPMDSLYFGWTLSHSKSVETKIVPRANGSPDNVLLVDFVNNRDPAVPIFQFVRLAPGKHIFSGDFKAEALATESGLVWRILCLDGPKNILATSAALSGNKQWDHFELRFEVPPSCTTQQLYLGMLSAAVLDQKVSGRAYYDNLSITPATASQ